MKGAPSPERHVRVEVDPVEEHGYQPQRGTRLAGAMSGLLRPREGNFAREITADLVFP